MKGLDGAIMGLAGIGVALLLLSLWLLRSRRPHIPGEPDHSHPLVPALLGLITLAGALVLELGKALGMHAP